MSERKTIEQLWADFRRENKLPNGYATARFWSVALWHFNIFLPNFRWRQRAIIAHDMHHLITGYPCTMRGECLIAAWEYGAGPCRHPAAVMFCLPLIFIGFLFSPKESWLAFRRGREMTSLHRHPIHLSQMQASLEEIAQDLESQRPVRKAHFGVFLAILCLSAATIMAPLTLLLVAS